jgi:hypothetical protein
MTDVLFFIVLVLGAGTASAWSQRRAKAQFAALPPDAQRRMKTFFVPTMFLILVGVLLAIYLARPHA